jgi:hypothetical protein
MKDFSIGENFLSIKEIVTIVGMTDEILRHYDRKSG